MTQKMAIGNILDKSKKELATLPVKEQGITWLMREAQRAQGIYIMLNKRYEEARINEVMQPTDIKMLDAAVASKSPIKPQKMRNTIFAAVLGLFAGIFWAFLLEYINRPIMSDQEAKWHLKLPILGIMPDFEKVVNVKSEPLWNIIRNMEK